jgi:SAM-dependent methyltransferase
MSVCTIVASTDEPHSADQFGPQRDFWWHKDFLDLMASRWRLHEAASLADIGCGQCHWSRLLYPYLRQPARFAAVDREEAWVAAARETFRRSFPDKSPDLWTFAQGDATSIPLPDDTFDIVTCQTVLMHLRDPNAALREMLRIARPGGLVVCVEPNNFWNYVAFTSLTPEESVEELVDRFEFWLRYHRGLAAAGKGDHTIGDRLPGYFAHLGLSEIMVHQSDRAGSLFPPYSSSAQRTLIEEERSAHKAGSGPWDTGQVRNYVRLGGGSDDFCDRIFEQLQARFAREQEAITAGHFHGAFGSLFYLVSGRKPTR